MAQDWIKMRCELQSHPKVVRILSATGTDKFRVVGGLHAVWSVFDAHSVDGALKGYTPELMDHIIGWPGFSRAMESVGWLQFDGLETLTLPEFTEHNGQSAKRRAEDQKRKRNGRNRPQSVRNLSASDADENRTREREEKEKEEKQKQDAPVGADLLADVDPKVAADFRKLRKGKKAELTETAVAGLRREAAKAGVTLESALRTCCERGWVGFKADWVTGQAQAPIDRSQLPGGGRRAL